MAAIVRSHCGNLHLNNSSDIGEMSSTARVPLVDFSSCAPNKELKLDDGEVQRTIEDVVNGLKEYGCVYLINHGVDTEDLAELRKTSRQFFNLPRELKLKCIRKAGDGSHPGSGWVADEMEYFANKKADDLKEFFSINLTSMDYMPWPNDDTVPGFRDANTNVITKLADLTTRTLKMLGQKLSPEDPDIFNRAHTNIAKGASNCYMRNLYYPSLDKYADRELPLGQERLSAHTDFGTITFLLQDHVGGLEVRAHDGSWFEAKPLEGAIILQAADLLERWTSGRIKAPLHRVCLPTDDKKNIARESTVFFVHPDSDFVVKCLDGSDAYPPVTGLGYLLMRIGACQTSDEEVRKKITD